MIIFGGTIVGLLKFGRLQFTRFIINILFFLTLPAVSLTL